MCGGLVNKPTNDSSISPSHHATDDTSKQNLTVAHETSHEKHSPEQKEEASLFTNPEGNPVKILKLCGVSIIISHKTLSSADTTKKS